LFRELFGIFTASRSSVNVAFLNPSRVAMIATLAEFEKGPEILRTENGSFFSETTTTKSSHQMS